MLVECGGRMDEGKEGRELWMDGTVSFWLLADYLHEDSGISHGGVGLELGYYGGFDFS